MLLELHVPASPLDQYVELFTYYEGYFPEHTIERLLPEGVVEVIIDLTETPKFIFDNERLTEKQGFTKAWLSGTRMEFISISAGGENSSMFVIRFRPGMAYPFLRMPISELKGTVIDADLVFGNQILEVRSALLDAETPQEKFQVVTSFLQCRLAEKLEVNPVVQYMVEQINANPTNIAVKEIVQRTGYSHKHLVSLFSKFTGLMPKQYLRLMKFQRVVHHIEQMNEIQWSRVAYESGYYDQAHFINDFRAFSGFSPLEYVNAKGETINYIPIK